MTPKTYTVAGAQSLREGAEESKDLAKRAGLL